MKRWTLLTFALFAALLTLPALADSPEITPTVDTAVEAPAEAPATTSDDVLEFERFLGLEGADAVCKCRDLCRSDSQCELQYGAGSQCLPQGPCGCKVCYAAS